MLDWAEELSCAITVCDTHGVVVYQNKKSKATFASYGNIIGRSLKDCHKPDSWSIITKLISENTSNSYTIEKDGIKKLIHQTPWYSKGKISGLIEFSIELPLSIPHYIR